MATLKTPTTIFYNVTLTHDAADTTSSVVDLQDGYNSGVLVKITNAATGPTVAAQFIVYISADNSNWYSLVGAFVASLGNSVVSQWAINIPIWAKYLKIVAGSNTGQNVTIRAELVEVADINA